MKIFAFAAAAVAALSAVEAAEQTSIHLRIHEKGGWCTITNESQCNGQNWTGSTCCADTNYECRWSDDGQNVQRCQKKKASGNTGNTGASCTITNESQCNGQNWSGSTCCADSSYECRWSDGQNVQRCQKKWGKHHHHHKTVEEDSDEDFSEEETTDEKHRYHHKEQQKKSVEKDASCTITNESQCDGQNWTGSTCCADSSYECRDSDDGQNVKRCQKIADGGYTDTEDSDSESNDTDDSYVDDYSYGDDIEYTSYVDDYGDCTKIDVGCSNPTSYCISHSESYAQCKPEALPPGELCGQDDGTNVWGYPYCTSGETCEPNGTDYRCTKSKKRHHHHRQHRRT